MNPGLASLCIHARCLRVGCCRRCRSASILSMCQRKLLVLSSSHCRFLGISAGSGHIGRGRVAYLDERARQRRSRRVEFCQYLFNLVHHRFVHRSQVIDP
eukprot:7383571-Prymnesium_polylepis.2